MTYTLNLRVKIAKMEYYIYIYIYICIYIYTLYVSFLIKTRKGIYNDCYISSTHIDLYEIPHIFNTQIIPTHCLRTPTGYHIYIYIYNKDNNAETAISIINYLKLNPHWGNGNKATEKTEKRKLYCPDFIYVIQGQHILTWSKATTNVSCMSDRINPETHSHWMYRPGPYKGNLLLCKQYEGAVPKYWNKNVMSFLKAVNIYGKI